MRRVYKQKDRGVTEFRPFVSPQEFEEVTGIKIFDRIYLRCILSDTRIYAHLPYLGYVMAIEDTESKLVFGYKPIKLEILFDCYTYSLDGHVWKPFGVHK